MKKNWEILISKIAYWKQMINDNDKIGAFPWHLPRISAGSDKISKAENCMGIIFPDQYREFISIADGWKGFCVSIDLFGTEEFLNGKANNIKDRTEVQQYILENDIDIRNIIPIGSSDIDIDIILLISDATNRQFGRVVWLAGYEIDRYNDFYEFFEAMVDYNARLLQKLVNQNRNS